MDYNLTLMERYNQYLIKQKLLNKKKENHILKKRINILENENLFLLDKYDYIHKKYVDLLIKSNKK